MEHWRWKEVLLLFLYQTHIDHLHRNQADEILRWTSQMDPWVHGACGLVEETDIKQILAQIITWFQVSRKVFLMDKEIFNLGPDGWARVNQAKGQGNSIPGICQSPDGEWSLILLRNYEKVHMLNRGRKTLKSSSAFCLKDSPFGEQETRQCVEGKVYRASFGLYCNCVIYKGLPSIFLALLSKVYVSQPGYYDSQSDN